MTDQPTDQPTKFVAIADETVRYREAQQSIHEARGMRSDETIAGGFFLVGDLIVDANGIPITDVSLEELETQAADRRAAMPPRAH